MLDDEPGEVDDRPEAVIYDLDAARRRLERGRRRRVRAGSDGRLIFRL